jgi:hypothetical protein
MVEVREVGHWLKAIVLFGRKNRMPVGQLYYYQYTLSLPRLFITERHHWVYTRRAAGRNVTGQQRNRCQQSSHPGIGQRVS